MGRKIAIVILAIAIFCMGVVPAFAASDLDRIEIEQVYSHMPSIDVYFNMFDAQGAQITDYDFSDAEVIALLGGEKLQKGSISPFKQSGKGTCYFFLLDVSKSIAPSVFDKAIEALSDFVQSMPSGDSLVLITFGNTLNVVLSGSEDKDTALSAIKSVDRTATKTRFFDAVDMAIKLAGTQSESLPERRVIMAVTDGEDVYEGGNTKNEALKKLTEANLPMFALGIDSASNKYIDSLGEFARESGGTINMIKASNIKEKFFDSISYIEGCYVLKLSAKNNIVDGSAKQLSVQIKTQGLTLASDITVKPQMWEKDVTIPGITSVEVSGEKEMTVSFSEEVTGADIAASYTVVSEQGVKSTAANAEYNLSSNKAIVTLKSQLYNGKYTLELKGIYDVSMERNPVTESFDFMVEGRPLLKSVTGGNGDFFSNYWWLFAALAAAAIFIVIILVTTTVRKKKTAGESITASEDSEVLIKQHVASKDGRRLKITVIDRNGIEKVLDVFVNNKITIGRSDTCDIYFDDMELSRQHAAISFSDGNLYIEDLGSMNGTAVNGVKLGTRRKIDNGDKVEMGQTKMILAI